MHGHARLGASATRHLDKLDLGFDDLIAGVGDQLGSEVDHHIVEVVVAFVWVEVFEHGSAEGIFRRAETIVGTRSVVGVVVVYIIDPIVI